MSSKQKLMGAGALAAALVGAATWHIHNTTVSILQPRGTIGQQEKRLIITAVALSLVVVIPVYIMLFGFAWRYREGNKKAKYDPDFDRSRLFESIWWGIPLILISILAVITWRSSHQLDPFKTLNSSKPAMTIQVVSLQWKWLFIYPGQNVASVNFVQFPVNTPVTFEITSDAPMNSFWIPQLGGQIYAMSGMATHLNLEASQTGSYRGSSANISGAGFSSMHFIAKASSEREFDQWVKQAQASPNKLSASAYNQMARPSDSGQIGYFSSPASGLFNQIINKYMEPVYFRPATESP